MPLARRGLVIWGGLTGAVLISVGLGYFLSTPDRTRSPAATAPGGQPRFQEFGDYTLWWDAIPAAIAANRDQAVSGSNLRPADYAGPEACKNCHKKQYDGWSEHPHRWMNALVEDAQIAGDFTDQKLAYLGGEVTFFTEDDRYGMRLARGDIQREYLITQTIGSRFFQYYVGRQRTGPEAADHPLYHDDHVLPLGYWISRREWVPVVHVHGEVAENERHDPYAPRTDWPVKDYADYADRAMDLYRSQCNYCHTTFAAGDMFVRHQRLFARHIPAKFDLSLPEYVQAARSDMWPENRAPRDVTDEEFATILKEFHRFEAKTHAVTLGVSCEACHLGNREHVAGQRKKPAFFPHAPEAVVRGKSVEHPLGRTHENVNWACGRCHAGHRPQLAAGMATWNSTEYSDAMRGSCYSQLTCTKCHDPHQAMGQSWSRTPAEDDAVCLSCHQQFVPHEPRLAHTRHAVDSEGSRCMNCHMPRINEGLEEVVRTHMIFSPTNSAMIESNQPNACNQCHAEQSIDWTLGHLKEWYGARYDQRSIQANYRDREASAAKGWLQSKNESVRLVAADSLTRAKATWALPDLWSALDDPFVLNRQFARIGLERMLDIRLSDFGYQFYHLPEERKLPIEQLREKFAPPEAQLESAER